ncbi:TetR/AcrR family transcriptional regulator [Vulgatibacter sp.]|uniref:TetR/AcrR family transcriptional regulator n=1 Tax=Vulgatibacter sp. TaxID=1971226 RepID=UPI0035619012
MVVGARRDGIERRDAVLDAALRCFNDRGVLLTGIEEIRRAAGASPSSIYHLFGGLPGITTALLVRIFEQLFASLAAAIAKKRTAKGSVTALVAAHIDWILAHPDEGRFMYQAMSLELGPAVQEPLQLRKAELLAPIAAHLRRFIERGDLPRWSPLQLDVVLLGPSHEALRRHLAGAPLDPAWMRTTLPALAWQSVAPRGRLLM